MMRRCSRLAVFLIILFLPEMTTFAPSWSCITLRAHRGSGTPSRGVSGIPALMPPRRGSARAAAGVRMEETHLNGALRASRDVLPDRHFLVLCHGVSEEVSLISALARIEIPLLSTPRNPC